MIVSLCKSGSTALIHSLSHAPDVICYLQTVKSGQRTSGQPDYGVYFEMHEGVVLSKETIGHSTVADCTLRIFPDDEAIRTTSPVFLFRDPVDTWASWSRAGWGTLELFRLAYDHALALYARARELAPGSTAIRYEDFGADCEAAFRGLCALLGVGFVPAMLKWRDRFPEGSRVIWRPDVQRDFDQGQSDTAKRAFGFEYRQADYDLPENEVEEINTLFRARWKEL